MHEVAEAEAVVLGLASELEGVEGLGAARGEQVDGVAVALDFEELPDGADLHECRRPSA
jgi:hypothetical protein